jgi:hypothetical protein
MARSYSTNSSNPAFNPGNRLNLVYRVRAVVDSTYVEGEYASVQELIDELGATLGIKNRGQVLRIRTKQLRSGKFSHVEITAIRI